MPRYDLVTNPQLTNLMQCAEEYFTVLVGEFKAKLISCFFYLESTWMYMIALLYDKLLSVT
jgi:hypothetical protein